MSWSHIPGQFGSQVKVYSRIRSCCHFLLSTARVSFKRCSIVNLNGVLTDEYISVNPGAAYEIINNAFKIDRKSQVLIKDRIVLRVFFEYCLGKFIADGDDFKSYAAARFINIYRPIDVMYYVLARHVLDVNFPDSDLFAVNEIIKPYFAEKRRPNDDFLKHVFSKAKVLKARAKRK